MRLEHSGISTDILLFSELGLLLTHHYRVYRGGLPHATFRSDYMARLRALLPTPRNTTGEPASPPETGRGATPRSARRSHRLSRPVRLMSEAVGELPLLTVQNNFDLDLAKVLLDVSVMPTMISPIEDSIVSPTTEVADYATLEIPTVEIVTESPGYAVPEDSEIMTSWVPKYSPASMTSTVGWEARPTSTGQPSPYSPPVSAAPPAGCTKTLDGFLPNMPSPLGESSQNTGQDEMTGEPETEVFVVEASTESFPAIGRQTDQVGVPDVSREGPYDVYDVPPESGQSPLILNSLPGCQYRMTSYDDRDSRVELDPYVQANTLAFCRGVVPTPAPPYIPSYGGHGGGPGFSGYFVYLNLPM